MTKDNFTSKIDECLEKNKDKIAIIESLKTEKSKKYTDDELFILWNYYQLKIGVPPFCENVDLITDEYLYCGEKIFGKDCADYISKTMDKELRNKQTCHRGALTIIQTYRDRGYGFLNHLLLEGRLPLQIKYLDDNGHLNKQAMEILKKIL